jgi:hypothetical protein
MSELFTKLRAPFAPDRISWRIGSTTHDKSRGLAMAYIDARDVMERLDESCGPGGWQCSYPHANTKTVCSIAIKVGDEWISKADGAGDTDVEAEKGALSDSFKRAAVRWGVGRYLYDLPATWVEIEGQGKSYKIKDTECAKLARVAGSRTPAPAAKQKEPSAKDALIEQCKRTIAASTEPKALGEWWNSNEEKVARKFVGLDQTECNALKELVMAKHATMAPTRKIGGISDNMDQL